MSPMRRRYAPYLLHHWSTMAGSIFSLTTLEYRAVTRSRAFRWRNGKKVIDVNLTGVFLCTREAMAIMKRQGGGRIINIGSISAQMPRINSAPYTTSKHGLVGLTKSTALEGRRHGISAGCLHPGNTLTDMGRSIPGSEPMMGAEDLAEMALAMAALPAQVTALEAIVLPYEQDYLGRG